MDESKNFPLAATRIHDFYMDNEMSGSDDLEELLTLQREMIQMLSAAGMTLRKFAANHEKLLAQIPNESIETLVAIEGEQNTTNALGLSWSPTTDKFFFKVPDIQERATWTKRLISSEIHKLFDPLGWLGPIFVIGNIVLQRLWIEGIDWDENPPEELQVEWRDLYSQLPLLKSIQKSRLVVKYHHKIQLQGFADACKKSYGAVLYVRSENENGDVSVELLCSQSRVAPQPNKKRKKPVTLPKLELNATVLLAKLVARVVQSIEINFHSVQLWSDSTIVLSWIKEEPSKFIPYIARRVTEVQNCTRGFTWSHVPGKQNPADIISRGMTPQQLLASEMWWNGPNFLQHPQLIEPQPEGEIAQFESECYVVCNDEANNQPALFAIKKFDHYNKLIRHVAWILRFVHNSRAKRTQQSTFKGELSYKELSLAERALAREIQQQTFSKEVKQLRSGKPVDNKSKLLSLNPQWKDGVMTVGGRLSNSQLSDSQKHPIIIPSNHYYTKLLIQKYHQDTMHGGAQLVLSKIRNKFWIPQGKSKVRQIIRQCITCFKVKPRYITQIMGDLPIERVTPNRPFAVTGLDYCGFFKIVIKSPRSLKLMKVWVCVFVCFATKAAHLEPVTDLTTEAFRSCLTRFMARRGKCIILNSDNQSTFHGATRVMKDEIQQFLTNPEVNETIKHLCAKDGIEWRFIPAKCPHVGGLWESCVKAFKHHFKRVASDTTLTLENFFTLVYAIEGQLNSRPLTPLSEDPNDFTVLTPGHFLIGEPLNAPVEPDVSEITFNRLNQYEKRIKLQQMFWKSWSRNYLNTLQQRNKWKIEKHELKPNELVLIVEDNIPSTKWIVGKVVRTSMGNDDRIRMVDILQPDERVVRRSVQRVCPLPIEEVDK